MKNYLFQIILVLAFLPAGLSAQEGVADENRYSDVLYLKDGSVLKGRLHHYIQGDRIFFELSTGDVVDYPDKEVARLVQGGVPELPGRVKRAKTYEFRETGAYFAFSAGLAVGRTSGNESAVAPGLTIGAGYQFNRLLGVGAGFGVDAYSPDRSEIVYPFYAEVRSYIGQSRQSPYYAVRAGYGFVSKDEEDNLLDARGGIYVNPALGMRWGASSGVNFVSELGLQFQHAEFTRPFGGPGEIEIQQKKYRRLVFRLGIVF